MPTIADQLAQLRRHIEQTVVGQKALIDRLLISLLTGGHLLLEGPPGLAKTTAVKTLASGVHALFQRIQFTPDLMPADLTGSDVYDPKTGEFHFIPGPLFHQIILADEINRAPPKVQSALLEAMEEQQITVGTQTHRLSKLFLVIATQNPLEHSGTYPLPEAQLDRFLFHVRVDYPNAAEELEILNRGILQARGNTPLVAPGITPELIFTARSSLATIHVEDSIKQYIVNLVTTSRTIEQTDKELTGTIRAGASPRASKALLNSACAYAFLEGRDYVTPDDVYTLAHDCLRHRLILSYDAIVNNISADKIIDKLLLAVQSP